MKSKEETNKAFVLKAMDTLLEKRAFAVGMCPIDKGQVKPDPFEFIEY